MHVHACLLKTTKTPPRRGEGDINNSLIRLGLLSPKETDTFVSRKRLLKPFVFASLLATRFVKSPNDANGTARAYATILLNGGFSRKMIASKKLQMMDSRSCHLIIVDMCLNCVIYAKLFFH